MSRVYEECEQCYSYHSPTGTCRSEPPKIVADPDSPWVIQGAIDLPQEISLDKMDIVPVGSGGFVSRAAEFAIWPRVQTTDWCGHWNP